MDNPTYIGKPREIDWSWDVVKVLLYVMNGGRFISISQTQLDLGFSHDHACAIFDDLIKKGVITLPPPRHQPHIKPSVIQAISRLFADFDEARILTGYGNSTSTKQAK